MTMRPWPTPAFVSVACLLGGMLAALVHAPARWLAEPLRQASQGRLELSGAQGTLWRGQAWLTLTGGEQSNDRVALPSPLQWSVQGLTRLHLRTDCCLPGGATLHWQPGWGQQALRLDATQSQWPARVLTGLGAPWNTLQLDAQLALQTPGLAWTWQPGRRVQTQGQITLDVLEASSRLSTVRPLGSYRLHVQWPEGASGPTEPSITLGTLEGNLQLSGQGQWLGGRLRLQGEAVAAPGREDALNNLMNLLGRRVNGRTQIKIG